MKENREELQTSSGRVMLVCKKYVFLSIFTMIYADGNAPCNTYRNVLPFMVKIRLFTSAYKASAIRAPQVCNNSKSQTISGPHSVSMRGGAAAVKFLPSGYNPFGYGLTDLGKQYLTFNGSAESDVGKFLSTLKSSRKTEATIKSQWLEIVRVSKQGQNMRIYRKLDSIIKFCLSAGFID